MFLKLWQISSKLWYKKLNDDRYKMWGNAKTGLFIVLKAEFIFIYLFKSYFKIRNHRLFFLQWMESKLNRLCVCNLTIGCRSSKLMRQTGIYFRPPNFPKMFPIFWVDICSSHFSISWMHSWVLHQVSSPLWPRISRVPSKEAACATWIIVNARYMANKPGK